MISTLTDALRRYGLIDDEDYLVPPEHPNVDALTRGMAGLLELMADGLKLTPQDNQRLKAMQRAFDYYNEALQDWEEKGDDDSFIDDDNFIDDEEESSSVEPEQLGEDQESKSDGDK